ncbi:MAG: FtsK/SpoIIIE domain-containing protein, partial [Candidatus Gribaldobacteria bacterium]|nr:FtsK/SpoIIIE domain-containing protein [Candidatus Gribaldobacteria bacterium]
FEVLRTFGARDIGTYNSDLAKKPKKQEEGFEQLPYIVLVIDELADLMMTKGKEVEASIVRLSQLARAVGIHLIVATQRPSVEVITGLIKANITSRIAFQVASQIDSRTILDCAGAEKLLGKGDMLFLSAEFSRPKRIQGCFVNSIEIKKSVAYIAKENTPEVPMQEFSETEEGENNELTFGAEGGKSLQEEITNFSAPDDLYDEAKQVVLQYKKASASLLQRRLQIGYARAARLLDLLETNGIIGPGEGAKPRDILVDENGNNDDGFMDASKVKFD